MKDLTKTLAKKSLAERAGQHFDWSVDRNLDMETRNYHKKQAIDYADAYFDIRGNRNGFVRGFGVGTDTTTANSMDSILALLGDREEPVRP